MIEGAWACGSLGRLLEVKPVGVASFALVFNALQVYNFHELSPDHDLSSHSAAISGTARLEHVNISVKIRHKAQN